MPSTLHAQGKAPHIVAVCAANVAAGTLQLVSGELPASVQLAAPTYVAHMWSALLIIGGVTALVGIYISDAILGLRLEAAGHVGVAGGCLVYAVALMFALAPPPWWPQPTIWWSIFIATASFVRWVQIWRTLKGAEREAKQLAEEAEQ